MKTVTETNQKCCAFPGFGFETIAYKTFVSRYEQKCETVYKERCSTEYELECTTGEKHLGTPASEKGSKELQLLKRL